MFRFRSKLPNHIVHLHFHFQMLFYTIILWCTKAANQGDVLAQYVLAVLYENGKGVCIPLFSRFFIPFHSLFLIFRYNYAIIIASSKFVLRCCKGAIIKMDDKFDIEYARMLSNSKKYKKEFEYCLQFALNKFKFVLLKLPIV